MLSALVQMFIQATYVGGIEAFNNDFHLHVSSKGEIIFAPSREIELTAEFKARFNIAAEGMGVTPIYASRCNFEGMDESDAREYLDSDIRDKIESLKIPASLSASYALIEIQIQGSKNSPEAADLQEELSSLDMINNISIQFEDGEFTCFKGTGSNAEPKAKKYVSLATGRPDRDTIISKDEVLDLKIALGQANTVEEFLAML